MSEHTPTPYKIYDDLDPMHVSIKGHHPVYGGAHVANIFTPANATFIVRACNAHDRLVAALLLAEDVLSRPPFSTQIWPNDVHPNTGITMIRAALAAAGVKP